MQVLRRGTELVTETCTRRFRDWQPPSAPALPSRPARSPAGAEPVTDRLGISVHTGGRGLAVVELNGEIDLLTAPELIATLQEPQVSAPGSLVLLDLSGLGFCDVTGLNALVRARRILGERGAWLALAAPPQSLTKLLAITGLDQLFEVFPQPARPQELHRTLAQPTGLPREALRDRRPYPARGARIRGPGTASAASGKCPPAAGAGGDGCHLRPRPGVPLDGDELDVGARGQGECTQVARVGGDDVISIPGQAHDRGVDRISQARPGEQHARPPTQGIIQGSDIYPGQQPGHRHLSPGPTAPHLRDHAAMTHRHPAGQAFPLDQRHRIPVPALDRYERTCIQHQHLRPPRAPPARPCRPHPARRAPPPLGRAPGEQHRASHPR